MKRHPALHGLSEDHHHGLVLALRCRRAGQGDAGQAASAWGEVQQRFAEELEPHFSCEEQLLLPALEAAGQSELVERTRDEHRAIRGLVDAVAVDPLAQLTRFAELLHDHIRFEERELFEAAQQELSSAQLDEIGRRWPKADQRDPP